MLLCNKKELCIVMVGVLSGKTATALFQRHVGATARQRAARLVANKQDPVIAPQPTSCRSSQTAGAASQSILIKFKFLLK